MHKQGAITLAAVVANGGQQSNKRAKLAQRILDLLEVNNVPVGIGSQGKAYAAKPHEYALVGYESVDESRLVDGGELLADVLRRARRASLSFVLISSMRDVADLIADKPELFVAKVRHVCIQGGLEPSETAPSGYVGDSSVNNGARARESEPPPCERAGPARAGVLAALPPEPRQRRAAPPACAALTAPSPRGSLARTRPRRARAARARTQASTRTRRTPCMTFALAAACA